MVRFPETAAVEWQVAADAVEAEVSLRKRIKRGTEVESRLEELRVRNEAEILFQAELDAENAPGLEMITLTEYKANPAAVPAELIEGVMKEDGLLVVVGASESGKTTLALQMIHSLLSGDKWLDQDVTKVSAAGVLSYDMDASLMFDWMSNWPNVDPDLISVVNAYKRGNPLGVPADRAKIAEHWKSMGVGVVVVDSFSASFFGENQNDAAATMAHYRDLKLFALTEVGAKALVVIAHSTDSSPHKVRGSTVHKDTADSMVSVLVDPDTDKRTVRVEKYRASLGQTKMSPMIITAPDDVTHLVSLDPGAMQMAGHPLPPGIVASAFTSMPTPTEAPDTESEGDEDEG